MTAPETWAEVPQDIRELVIDFVLRQSEHATRSAEHAESVGLAAIAPHYRTAAHAAILAAEALGWVDPRGEEKGT